MIHRPRLLLLLLPAALAWGQSPPPPDFRLGDDVRPTRYAVRLTLAPPQDTFSGTVDIEVDLRRAASVIWMHGAALTASQASVRAAGRTETARVVMAKGDFLGLVLDRPLGPGSASIHIAYQGTLSKGSSDGLFLNRSGSDWYVFSQFEPLSARRAFPCFDEPRFKTPWQLTLEVPKGNSAFSNTPQVSSADGPGGTTIVKFAPSKPLPSYLVALAVGPLDIVDAGRAGMHHVPLRILVPRGRAESAAFAARVTREIVERLENYFGIPYPYEKLDSVALPLVYGFGAMENAGLVTYAENLILARPADQSAAFEREYVSIAMHELAHQWFGDLVTMAWWDDTWLNEGFATWAEQKLVGEWNPAWRWEVESVIETQRAMATDSLTSARAVRQPIRSNDDIANAFDTITYQKGAAIMRMFENWVGPEKFQKGVRLYLARHAWGNATTEEFLSDVSAGAGRNIRESLGTFLNQPGVPLVSLALDCGGSGAVVLSQKRYLPLGSPGAPPQSWQTPVCVRDAGETKCTLLGAKQERVAPGGHACPDWVVGNAAQNGYYRLAYDGELLGRLLQGSDGRLTPAERAGLLGDAQALVRGGELPAAQAYAIAANFAGDTDRQIVTAAARLADSMQEHLVPPDLRPGYQRYIRNTFGTRARRLGWETRSAESEDDRLLRPVLVDLVARRGEDPSLISEARRLTEAWLRDHSAVGADATRAVLQTAAQFGDAGLYDKFLTAARAERDSRARRNLITALGSFRDPALARRALDLTLSADFDPRETFELLFGPLQYDETSTLPFEFVEQHYEELVARLPKGAGSEAGAVLPRVGSAFCSLERRDELQKYFADRVKQFTGGPRNLALILESIQVCAAVQKAQQPSSAAFLNTVP